MGSGLLDDWAEELLRHSSQIANLERVWMIEPGAICFTTKGRLSTRQRARTAVLKDGTNGPMVARVIDGWPLTDIPEEAGGGG